MQDKAEYKVLARKYRPQNFSQMVGHESLVKTLSNAILQNKIAHAFILTGIRGIGKTTTARLIAKSLNCIGENGQGNATISPCDKCHNCLSIIESTSQDVIEFDAASHTGVDDIRGIIDTIAYAPVSARYKIYIIDEVHMLSKSAFNALLKTLEEPPKYVKFIFATTEINKIPITILSRCQRFDLKRISFEDIKSQLKFVANAEGVDVEERALNLLASASEGSVRDSQSLLDRAFSHNEFKEKLTENSVAEMLGFFNKDAIYVLYEMLLQGDVDKSIKQFNEIANNYTSISSILLDLTDISYSAILAKTLKDFNERTNLPSNHKENLLNISKNVSLESMMKIWNILTNAGNDMKSSFDDKKFLEITLIKICYGSQLPSLSSILKNKNIDSAISSDNSSVDEVISMFENAKII